MKTHYKLSGKHEVAEKVILMYCYNIIGDFLFGLMYQFATGNAPYPMAWEKFCEEFKNKNISIVVVQMATESITVSVKDKKFTFESQVSAIGIIKHYFQ